MIGPPIQDPRNQDRKRKALQAALAAQARRGGSRLSKFAKTGVGRASRGSGPLANRGLRPGAMSFLQPRGLDSRGLNHAQQVATALAGVMQRHAAPPMPTENLGGGPLIPPGGWPSAPSPLVGDTPFAGQLGAMFNPSNAPAQPLLPPGFQWPGVPLGNNSFIDPETLLVRGGLGFRG